MKLTLIECTRLYFALSALGIFILITFFENYVINDMLQKLSRFTRPYDVQSVQADRQKTLIHGCRHHPNRTWKRQYVKNFYVDDDRRFLYCYVPKVASTNWKRLLVILSEKMSLEEVRHLEDSMGVDRNPSRWVHSGVVRRSLNLTTLYHYNDTEIQYRLDNYFTFMFVRHPFHRLVAAYRDKFTNQDNFTVKAFQYKYGRKIIRTYRKNPSNESLTTGNDVHFDEFIRFIADTYKRTHYKKLNVHWRPFSKLCIPCRIRYDFVGHLETLQSDADYILSQIAPDLIGSDVLAFPRAIKGPSSYRYKESTGSVIRNYFRNVTTDALNMILRTYSLDFDLFGYRPFLNDDA